jgi:hypothetical protein
MAEGSSTAGVKITLAVLLLDCFLIFGKRKTRKPLIGTELVPKASLTFATKSELTIVAESEC